MVVVAIRRAKGTSLPAPMRTISGSEDSRRPSNQEPALKAARSGSKPREGAIVEAGIFQL